MTENSKKEFHLHEFRLQLTRGQTTFLLSAVFLALLTSPIATESVTLTTYYPAPAGAYNNMVTIGNTWLARDNQPGTSIPSFVELGSNTGVSPGTKLAVMNGNVGINTATPQATLDIEPSMTTCCSSYGCLPCAENALRINNGQSNIQAGNVWTATDQWGDGAWQQNASLNCNQYEYGQGGHTNPTYAYCPSNTQMTGGGCSCQYGTILTSFPASSNSWNCWCTGLNYAGAPSPWAYSYAICCQ